jgi:alcohol dehydrogenase class IV
VRFAFASAGRIAFGRGRVAEAAPAAAALGRRALVVTGRDTARAVPLVAALAEHGIEAGVFAVPAEPTVALASAGARAARDGGAEVVLGLGGGSALDAAKAIAALAANDGDPLRYLEVVGEGRPLERPPLPVIAIPTTAGTGSEATRNAVLAVPERGVKVSLRHEAMLPRVAIVDPELAVGLPAAVTAATGLDALTQLVEPFVSPAANPLTDALAREALPRVPRALRRAVADGADLAAREELALAALFGGLALANARLGAVHGLAAPLGGVVPAPHGVVCARLLPEIVAVNARALAEREPGSPSRARYDEVARIVTGDPTATVTDAVEFLRALVEELAVPRLSTFGLARDAFGELIARAQRASSMQGNPLRLTDGELAEALERAL